MTTYVSATQVANEIKTRIEGITVANGFHTDIGLKLFRGKTNAPDKDNVPCSVLLEGDDEIKMSDGRKPLANIKQHYAIGGYDICDADHPNDQAHLIIKDIKRALFGAAANFDNAVYALRYKGREIGPRADSQPIVWALVHITVEYYEDLANP